MLAPFKQLQRISKALLEQRDFQFCICGGLAASLYRKIPRLTEDLYICIYLNSNLTLLSSENLESESKDKAEKFIESINLKPSYGWISSNHKEISGQICLIIGTNPNDSFECSVDMLLPIFPWVKNAVERSQHNLIDYGFAKLPTMTPEDLIISKSYAVSIQPNRYQDLDDIKNILNDIVLLDKIYIEKELERLKINLPC